ncbi:MAG: hypothetical protein AAF962_09405 [Actinomycetota bacterium]
MATVLHPRSSSDPTATPSPPSGRRLATLVFVALAGLVAVLSFADRAPGLVRRGLRASVRLSNAIEDATGLSVIDARDLPYSWDLVGHFALWLTVAVVGWWTYRRRLPATVLALVLFIGSYAVEIGQSYLSTTRTPDPQDLVANALGIAVGMTLAVTGGWIVARVRGRGPARPPVAEADLAER